MPSITGIYFNPTISTLLFQRAGLPITRTYLMPGAGRHQLDDWVTRLGGYPVVIKLMGYSRGLGVMRADSPESLSSIVDFASADGRTPYWCAYVESALHWRLMVVGGRVVAATATATITTIFGPTPGEFDWMHGVVVDSKGAVYAADTSGQRIQKFVPLGQ